MTRTSKSNEQEQLTWHTVVPWGIGLVVCAGALWARYALGMDHEPIEWLLSLAAVVLLALTCVAVCGRLLQDMKFSAEIANFQPSPREGIRGTIRHLTNI